MSYNNSDLAHAFPASVQDDILQVTATLPQPSDNTEPFPSSVEGQTVFIPYRVYHDPALIDCARLTPMQQQLLDCLLTRHHSGFVREKHLRNIAASNHAWIPPFIVQLVGEYVIEILDAIRDNLHRFDPTFLDGQSHIRRSHEAASHQLLGPLLSPPAQRRLRRFSNRELL